MGLLALAALLFATACSSDPADDTAAPPADTGPASAPPEPGVTQPATPEPPAPSEPSAAEPPGPAEGLVGGCGRPYVDSSPWNTPIGPSPSYDAESERFVAGLGDQLTSDPTQFTYPVYEVSADTPLQDVVIYGWFSNVQGDGRTMENDTELTVQMPIPPGAEPAAGDDAQIILVDPETGDEWGAWHFERSADGTYLAENAYHYNTRWDAVPPPSTGGGVFVNRGAGVPYLAGLVRYCEIEQGRIEHALAFAYDSPSSDYVYPATKSDGEARFGQALPEGARLQLDPALTAEDLAELGCSGPCLTVARALQEYGMFVIDNSGRSKVMFEYVGTADWRDTVDENTVSSLPFERFLVIETRMIPASAGCTITGTEGDDVLVGTRSADVICGLGGDDELRGLAGNDIIYGGDGEDTILGGAGQDPLDAGEGSDEVWGGPGRDVIEAGPGADEVVGGRGNDRLLVRDGEQDDVDGGLGRDEAIADADDRLVRVEQQP